MCAFAGSKSLNEAGIHGPKDLLPLPWDNDEIANRNLPTEDEIREMQAEMDAWNAMLNNKKSSKG